MGKFFLDDEFKELHSKWTQKLKESGFEDIENPDRETLRTPHSHYFFTRYTPEEIEERLTYYNQCMEFYWRYAGFKSKREKEIWFLYSEGKSKREIAEILSKNKKKICHNLVQYYIGRLRKIMHTQSWPSSEQGINGRDDTEKESDYLSSSDPADLNFILSTWLRGLYFGNDYYHAIDQKSYFFNYDQVIKKILSKPNIFINVCCLKEDPNVILGYAVMEKEIIHWMFVKSIWRGIGIAKDLMKDHAITTTTHLTNITLKSKPKRFKFDPFLI